MLRYFHGAQPGKKRPAEKSLTERASAKRSYETNRQRTFQNHWKEGREWLFFDNEKNEMSCIVCKKSKPDDPSPFVKGSNYFRLDIRFPQSEIIKATTISSFQNWTDAKG